MRSSQVIDRLLAVPPSALETSLSQGLVVSELNTGLELGLSARQVGELLAFEMADMADQQFSWQVALFATVPLF